MGRKGFAGFRRKVDNVKARFLRRLDSNLCVSRLAQSGRLRDAEPGLPLGFWLGSFSEGGCASCFKASFGLCFNVSDPRIRLLLRGADNGQDWQVSSKMRPILQEICDRTLNECGLAKDYRVKVIVS